MGKTDPLEKVLKAIRGAGGLHAHVLTWEDEGPHLAVAVKLILKKPNPKPA